MNFELYRDAQKAMITKALRVPLVHPLELGEEVDNHTQVTLAGHPFRILTDSANLLYVLSSFGPRGVTPGRLLWQDLYEKGEPYDPKDLAEEVARINDELRPGVLYPSNYYSNPSNETDLVSVVKIGRGYSYGLNGTKVYLSKTLSERARVLGAEAYTEIPLNPIEAGVITTAVLQQRSDRFPFIGPLSLPETLKGSFEEAPLRKIGGISNAGLERLRYEAYAKVIYHKNNPDIPFNSTLVDLQEFLGFIENELTRPTVVQALRPSGKESYAPIFSSKK